MTDEKWNPNKENVRQFNNISKNTFDSEDKLTFEEGEIQQMKDYYMQALNSGTDLGNTAICNFYLFKLISFVDRLSIRKRETIDENVKIKNVTPHFKKGLSGVQKEIDKMMLLLRRTYNVIEESHLNDHKLISNYIGNISFPRSLGSDIFNYLSNKSEEFKKTTLVRQKRFLRKQKKNNSTN